MKVRKEFSELATMLKTTPMAIADYFGVSPTRLEILLKLRGKMRSDETCLKDATIRNYGKSVYAKCETLLGVCPFEADRKTNGETGGASHRSRNGEREA